MLAVSNAEGVYYRYLKAWLLSDADDRRSRSIVTTYNRPDALAAVLDGYAAQSDRDFELIVADDGSPRHRRADRRVRAAGPVSRYGRYGRRTRASAPPRSATRRWRPADADYVIFTDGDCIPSHTFVAQHRQAGRARLVPVRQPRAAVGGPHTPCARRAPAIQDWTWAEWVRARGRREVNRTMPLVRLPDGAWRKRHARAVGRREDLQPVGVAR